MNESCKPTLMIIECVTEKSQKCHKIKVNYALNCFLKLLIFNQLIGINLFCLSDFTERST